MPFLVWPRLLRRVIEVGRTWWIPIRHPFVVTVDVKGRLTHRYKVRTLFRVAPHWVPFHRLPPRVESQVVTPIGYGPVRVVPQTVDLLMELTPLLPSGIPSHWLRIQIYKLY